MGMKVKVILKINDKYKIEIYYNKLKKIIKL